MPTLKPILVLLSFCLVLASASAYTTRMFVPAVLPNLNMGNLTLIILNVTPGSGIVRVSGPSSVDPDTTASAQIAAAYAASMLGMNASKFNFFYTIQDLNTSVSGPSGGLAFTLLAVAGLQHRQLPMNFTATGTISPNGQVGLIGGAFDKAGAAERSGLRFVLVPAATNDSLEALIYYITQQTYRIPIVQVANVSQALAYAFGSKSPGFMSLNLTQTYDVAQLGNNNITCSDCYLSEFAELANFTMNYSSSYTSSIGGNFSQLRQTLLSNIAAYRDLFGKGYLYTSADLTFLDFMQAFTLANSQNINASSAGSLLDNISAYCSSLTPPPMTDTNYGFVVGGRMRQIWGNITIANAQSSLNNEETTDDIMQSVHDAASALGWCKAAYESYSIASSMGGNYVETSPSLKSQAFAKISSAVNSGGIYLNTSTQAYDSGDYATAIYAAVYANVFGPSNSSTLTQDQLYSRSLQNMNNATSGVWPSQFAMQSEFYLGQAALSQGAVSMSYLQQAYSTSQLAVGLESADGAIRNSFVIINSTPQGVPQSLIDEVNGIQQNVTQMYWILLFNAIMMFVILVVLLFHLLSARDRRSAPAAAARPAPRKRRR